MPAHALSLPLPLPPLQSILYPNMASWAAMWLSSLVLAAGLRHKELIRRELLRQGHVWTNNEAVARRMYTGARPHMLLMYPLFSLHQANTKPYPLI